jgi:hypothetical protein
VLLFIDKNRGKKEGDMDFFGKLEKAKGMYEMFAVLYEYRYPLLLVVGLIVTVLIVRSYLHGREIKKLKKVTGVHPGGSSDGQISIGHIENAYFLQTTPQDAKLLVKGEQPRLLQLPQGKIICPQCHRENPSGVGMCLYCDQVFFLRTTVGAPAHQGVATDSTVAPATPQPQAPARPRFVPIRHNDDEAILRSLIDDDI